MRSARTALLAASLASLLGSCAPPHDRGAVVWTDVPELALAVEAYDATRDPSGTAIVTLRWKPDLAAALATAADPPALAVGRYLGSSPAKGSFASLEYLLGPGRLDRRAFYPELLAAGLVGGRRVLLPLSFDLPVIAFAKGSPAQGDGFTLSLRDLLAPSAAFNRREGGAYSRMGFSPRWDGAFLVSALQAGGAAFAEGRELSWSEAGLLSALGEIVDWSDRANGPAALEEDFQFKYLVSPPYRYIKEGRALFASMRASALFLLPEERRAELDFRYFARDGRVAVAEGPVCAALIRGAPGRVGAEAFLRWLLSPEAQRAILERSRRARALDLAFGVAGGFSSIRSVNEELLPAYFPALVGHAPPALLAAPATLPEDWPELVAAVIAPWAVEATAARPARGPAEGTASGLSQKIRELPGRIREFRARAPGPVQ